MSDLAEQTAKLAVNDTSEPKGTSSFLVLSGL
jgi:hypothetical protein